MCKNYVYFYIIKKLYIFIHKISLNYNMFFIHNQFSLLKCCDVFVYIYKNGYIK